MSISLLVFNSTSHSLFFNVNDHFPMITNSSSASCDAIPISATNNKRLLFSRGETKFDQEQ